MKLSFLSIVVLIAMLSSSDAKEAPTVWELLPKITEEMLSKDFAERQLGTKRLLTLTEDHSEQVIMY